MINPYKVLGVSDNAEKDICKKAYRKLSALYHPDSTTSDIEKFAEVQEAWGMVSRGYVVLELPKTRSLSHSNLFTFSVIQ